MKQTGAHGDGQPAYVGLRPLRVLFAGGGTGGHLSPALAIAQTLRLCHPDAEVLFIGTADRLEASKVPAAGFAFRAISVHGLAGRWSFAGLARRLRALLEILTLLPLWQSLFILGQFQPDVVVGTGGYVCGPVLFAARLTRRTAILVEQNEEIGYTSRLVSRFIRLAAVISESSGAYFRAHGIRTEVVGNPVRPAILDTTRQQGIAALELESDRCTLAIVGGSLGSTPVNEAAIGALRRLAREHWFRDGWQVVHAVGPQRGGELARRKSKHWASPIAPTPIWTTFTICSPPATWWCRAAAAPSSPKLPRAGCRSSSSPGPARRITTRRAMPTPSPKRAPPWSSPTTSYPPTRCSPHYSTSCPTLPNAPPWPPPAVNSATPNPRSRSSPSSRNSPRYSTNSRIRRGGETQSYT